jgi:hypothetical protein
VLRTPCGEFFLGFFQFWGWDTPKTEKTPPKKRRQARSAEATTHVVSEKEAVFCGLFFFPSFILDIIK